MGWLARDSHEPRGATRNTRIGWVRAYSGWILGAGCVISSIVECIYIYTIYV